MHTISSHSRTSGVTLLEVIGVIFVLLVVAAVLFPCNCKSREKARQTSCLSQMKQLGLAMFQYSQDYDQSNPSGTQGKAAGPGGKVGVGWAGQLYWAAKSTSLFKCPDDETKGGTNPSGGVTYPISYGFNVNAAGKTQDQYGNAAKSVLLFEVEGAVTDMTVLGSEGNTSSGDYSSPASNGTTAGWNPAPSIRTARFATGILRGADPTKIGTLTGDFDAFDAPTGRHSDGSNFLLADGHAKWLRGSSVSAGQNDKRKGNRNCNTFTSNGINGLAAQTGCTDVQLGATFGVN